MDGSQSTRIQCDLLVPTAATVLQYPTRSEEWQQRSAELWHKWGEHDFERQTFTAAATKLEAAVTLRKKCLGKEHPDTLNSTYLLIDIYCFQFRVNEVSTTKFGCL